MTHLAKLAAVVTDFGTSNAMTVVPAVPERDFGPQVEIPPSVLDLPGFLALAGTLGGGVLYRKDVVFDPGEQGEAEDLVAALRKHKGKVGRVTVAFVANGVVHFWEQSTPWYLEWQETTAKPAAALWGASEQDDDDEREPRPSDEEIARLSAEVVETLLADPQFRAAKPGGARHQYARMSMPEGTHRWVAHAAVRDATARADRLAKVQYDQIAEHLDELATALLATPSYRQASAPAARRQVAEQFLVSHADGFAAPAHVRDDLYGRAQRLTKSGKHPTLL